MKSLSFVGICLRASAIAVAFMHCTATAGAAAAGPGWQCALTGSGAMAPAIVEASRDYLGRVDALYPHQVLGLVRSGDHYYLLNSRDMEWGDRTRLKLLTLRLAGLASSVEMTSSTALAPNAAISSGQTIAAPARATAVDRPALGVAPGGAPPQGGYVCLATSRAEREGLTRLPPGDVVLAAGQSVHLVNPQEPEIAIEVRAAPDRPLNLGEIFQRSARAGIYAGLVGQARQAGAATTLERPDGTLTFRTASTGGSAAEPRVETVRQSPEPVQEAAVAIAAAEPSLPPAPAPEKVAVREPPREPVVPARRVPEPAIVTVAVTPAPPSERMEQAAAIPVPPAPARIVDGSPPSVPTPAVVEPAAPRPAVVVATAASVPAPAPAGRLPAVILANPPATAAAQPYDDYANAMKTLMALRRSGSVRSVSEMTYVHPAVEILRQQR